MVRVDENPGHVCGSESREGGWQYPNLDNAGVVITLPVGQEGEHVNIQWMPVDVNAGPLLWGYFATLEAAEAGFDTTTSSGDTGVPVPNAPRKMERGGEDRQVPHGRRFLRLQAATTGKIFALVSSADKHRNPTGTDPDV